MHSKQRHPECLVKATPAERMLSAYFSIARTLTVFSFQTFRLLISLICSCEGGKKISECSLT